MRILVVEDEPKVAEFIRSELSQAQFTVDVAEDGKSALDRIGTTVYDLLILDIMLPDMDGFSVCRQVRSLGMLTPVLMLSARSLVDDRVRGLELGADDYLTKPFALKELIARVRACGRRKEQLAPVVLTAGDLTLDLSVHELRQADRPIELSPTELRLLEYLMRHRGQTLTR